MTRSLLLLTVTLALLGVLLAIGRHLYRRKNKGEVERPKYRMLQDD